MIILTHNPFVEDRPRQRVGGLYVRQSTMIRNTQLSIILIVSLFFGVALLLFVPALIFSTWNNYPLVFGVIDPAKVLVGLIYAAPLYCATIFLITRVARDRLLASMITAILAAVSLSYFMLQEFSPAGKLLLFSTSRFSLLLPFFVLIPLIIFMGRKQITDQSEQDSAPNPLPAEQLIFMIFLILNPFVEDRPRQRMGGLYVRQ